MGRRAYLSRHALDRGLALCMTLAVFGADWFRHATFRSGTYDLAVFEQVVWKMAHGHGATSSLTAWNTFGDHLSPILLVFVPFYRLAATPLWFFGAQAIALGLAVLMVRPLAKLAGLEDKPTAQTWLVVAFVLSPAIWNAALFDFHPTTVAVPVLLFGCIAGLRHHQAHMWLAMLGLVVLRDDLALAGIAIACVGFLSDTARGRRMRVALVGAGVGWTVIGAEIGSALGASRHFEARYGYLGESMTSAAFHPVHAVVGLVQHVLVESNGRLAMALLIPLALLPLGRPAWLAIAGFVALPTLASADPNFHSAAFHYGAPVMPFLVLAAAGTLARWSPANVRRVLLVGAPIAVVGMLTVGPVATESITFESVDPRDARAAVATLKPDDVVVAGAILGSHVAHRDELIPFPFPFEDVPVTFPLDPRVTSTSQARQDSVDVVIMESLTTPGRHRVLRQFLNSDVAQEEFTLTDFGTVLVFRRNA